MSVAGILRPFAWRLHCATGGRVPVDDLVQEGAIAAWLKAGEHESHAVTAGRSAMIDMLRRELGRVVFRPADLPLDFEVAGDDTTEASAITRQQARIVAEEIGRLSEPQRRIIGLHLDGLDGVEIARQTGTTKENVCQTLQRATRRLTASVAARIADSRQTA